MSSSITYSTKILTLVIAPFLLILVDILCEIAMVPDVYILLFLHQKDLKLCLTSYDYAKVIDELEKIQTRNSAVLLTVYNETK